MNELGEGTRAIIEKIANTVAEKYAEKYLALTTELVRKEIELHTSNCAANNYKGAKQFASAVLGGIIVAVVAYLLKNF